MFCGMWYIIALAYQETTHSYGMAALDIPVSQILILMGASMVQQCLRAGLLDEVIINLVPVLLGDGVRLFEAGIPGDYELAIDNVITATGVTHLTYRVVR